MTKRHSRPQKYPDREIAASYATLRSQIIATEGRLPSRKDATSAYRAGEFPCNPDILCNRWGKWSQIQAKLEGLIAETVQTH